MMGTPPLHVVVGYELFLHVYSNQLTFLNSKLASIIDVK